MAELTLNPENKISEITTDQIKSFEKELFKYPEVEMAVQHYFLDGIYCREITMLKGTLLTSKTHKTENVSIISKGSVIEVTERDGKRKLSAPHTMVSVANTKRALYILEDTIWTTIHNNPDNITDLKKLEDMIIETEELT